MLDKDHQPNPNSVCAPRLNPNTTTEPLNPADVEDSEPGINPHISQPWQHSDDPTAFSLWNLKPEEHRCIVQLLYIALAEAHTWSVLPVITLRHADLPDTSASESDSECQGPGVHETAAITDTLRYILEHQVIPHRCASLIPTLLQKSIDAMAEASTWDTNRAYWQVMHEATPVMYGVSQPLQVYRDVLFTYNLLSGLFWSQVKH